MKKILVLMALVMAMAANAHAFNKQYAESNSVEYFIDFWKQILKNEFTSAHQDYLVQKYPNGCPKQEIILYGDYGEEGEVETIPADDVITDMVSTHYNYFQANQYPTQKYVGEIFARIYKLDYYKHMSLYDLFVTNQLCLDLINRGDFERFMQNLDKSYYPYIDVESLTHAITEQDKVICSVLNACIYISMGNGGLEPLPSIFDGYYEFANAAEQEVFENEEVIGTQFTINQLTYEITSRSTVTLMSAGKNITSVFIPSVVTYNGLNYHVDKIGFNAFYKCQLLTSVTIPESVKSIGKRTFECCESLSSVTIPEGVTSIRERDFSSCSFPKPNTIPEGIMSFGNRVFEDSDSLAVVVTPDSVTSISDDIFEDYLSISSVDKQKYNVFTLLGSREQYGSVNIYREPSTSSPVVGTVYICYHGLCNEPVLSHHGQWVQIEEGYVKKSETLSQSWYRILDEKIIIAAKDSTPIYCDFEMAFFNDSAHCYYVPKGTIIDSRTDEEIYDLEDYFTLITAHDYLHVSKRDVEIIDFDELMRRYFIPTSLGSGIYAAITSDEEPYTAEIVYCDPDKSGHISIPENVYSDGISYEITSIAWRAFGDCSSITSVSVPNTVTSIDGYAFIDCISLKTLTLPKSLEYLDEFAFSGCTSLESIVVESGNKIYDSRENCNAVIETASNTLIAGCKKTIIPNSVTSIGEYAFSGCSSLESVVIPNSVKSIGDWAFSGCTFVKGNFINTSSLNAEANDYWGARIADVDINGLLIRNDTVIACRPHVTSITIPNSVRSIGEWAFYDCSSLTSITIPNSVTSIGEYAFSGCTSLEEIKYTGTQAQWGNIDKDSGWKSSCDATIVYNAGD